MGNILPRSLFVAAAALALEGCPDTSNHQSGDIKPDQAAAAIAAVIAIGTNVNIAVARQIECPTANDTTTYSASTLTFGIAANLPKINGAPDYNPATDRQNVDKATRDATRCVKSGKGFYTDGNGTRQVATFTYS